MSNVALVENDHPAVAKHDCPRRNEHQSTPTVVTKKKLRTETEAHTADPHTSHGTHHAEMSNPSFKQPSFGKRPPTSKCFMAPFSACSHSASVNKRHAKPHVTAVSDDHIAFDAGPSTFFTHGNKIKEISSASFPFVFQARYTLWYLKHTGPTPFHTKLCSLELFEFNFDMVPFRVNFIRDMA